MKTNQIPLLTALKLRVLLTLCIPKSYSLNRAIHALFTSDSGIEQS